METKVCCAHDVTTGRSLSSKVAVADLAVQPLIALKMLMDGLATDGVTSLWLRSLLGPPVMMHLFPFDFVYLNEDFRVLDAVELFPNMPFPKAEATVASALILPLRTLASTGTKKGDQLIICEQEELGHRLAGIAPQKDVSPVAVSKDLDQCEISVAAGSGAGLLANVQPTKPVFDERIPLCTSTVSPGAGFTVSLATTWQVASSTMPAAVVPGTEGEATTENASLTIVEAPPEETKIAAESTVAKAEVEQRGPVEALTVEEAPSAIETVPNAKPAEIVTTKPKGEPEAVLTTDQLCQALAAVEAAENATEHVTPAPTEAQIYDERIARSKEAWEKATVKTARASTTGPVRTKKEADEPKKDHLGTRVIRWLNLDDPLPERRNVIRLLFDGLQAYDVNDRNKRYEIRDICPTGFGLRTPKNWKRGQLVTLMIEKKGASEKDHERVRIQARVMRCDQTGTGLEFVFPKGTEFQPWKRVKTKRSDETEAVFILRELRLSHALGFLRRLCPGGSEQIHHALNDRLSNKRVACAVDIALLAEETLARAGQVNLASAHPDMVLRIIEGGSWIEDGWIRKLWSGLLVSSCTADGQDTSNQPFIDLLAKLTPLHLRILSFVCSKAVKAIAAGQAAKEFHLDCTSEELMEVSDSHSFARIQQTVGHLCSYGLFADIARPSYVTITEKSKTRLAPTAMGLKMWARCKGQRA